MNPHARGIGVISGATGIVFGLIPGLFDDLTDGVRELSHSVFRGTPAPPRRRTRAGTAGRHLGAAAVGAVILMLTVAAYVSH